MIEDMGLSAVVTAFPAIGVLVAWLATIRAQLNECQERYDRLELEYRQALKDMAGLRQQAIVNESYMAGRMFQAGDETLPMRPSNKSIEQATGA